MCIRDRSKRVARLATRAPVPVEVIPFARRPVADYLASLGAVSYTHLRAHETVLDLVCRLLLEKKKQKNREKYQYGTTRT